MRSVETRLSLWGAGCAIASGLLFSIPVVNALTVVAALALLIVTMARLGFRRFFEVCIPGIVAAAVVSSLTMGYRAGLEITGIYMMIMAAPALLMGWRARRFDPPGKTIIFGLLPMAVVFVLFMIAYAGLMADLQGLIFQFKTIVSDMIRDMPAIESLIAKSFPPAEGSVGRFVEAQGKIIAEGMKVLPGFIALSIIFMILAAYLLAGEVARRFRVMFPRCRPFHAWHAGGWWLALTVLGLIAVVFAGEDRWYYAGINILILTGNVYFIIGISIVESLIRRSYRPARVRLVFYLGMTLLGVLSFGNETLMYAGLTAAVFLTALGLADTRFNFRKETLETNND